MKRYSTIIIDDERLAREEVKRALDIYPDFEIVGEAANAAEALKLIESKQPDLIFLDIHMPVKSGFDLLEDLSIVPKVVFTTAYSQYAVKAFEFNAMDYIVKPLREQRFAQTIEKLRTEFTKAELDKSYFPMHYKVFIKDGEQCFFIPLEEIRLIQSMDNYARFFFGKNNAMLKRSLNLIGERLDPNVFFRINRSQIVNTKYIEKIRQGDKNKLLLELRTGEELEVSTRQSARFRNWNTF